MELHGHRRSIPDVDAIWADFHRTSTSNFFNRIGTKPTSLLVRYAVAIGTPANIRQIALMAPIHERAA
jgi:hypothetical protein